MNKIILTHEQIYELVGENRYKINPDRKFFSRCIDGRYKNDNNLAALAFPGADVGELALIYATANSYGFKINEKKVLKTIIKIIGGDKNFGIHTDSHADPKIPAGGCGHWKQINLDPKAYSLEQKNIDDIKPNLNLGTPVILQGDHLEGAVLMVSGDWGIYPQAKIETEIGVRQAEVFVYHQSLVDERHRLLAKSLVKNKAVVFKDSEDQEWLYNALSEMSENHLMETAKRLAKGLPIYEVKFNEDGNFSIKEQGMV